MIDEALAREAIEKMHKERLGSLLLALHMDKSLTAFYGSKISVKYNPEVCTAKVECQEGLTVQGVMARIRETMPEGPVLTRKAGTGYKVSRWMMKFKEGLSVVVVGHKGEIADPGG